MKYRPIYGGPEVEVRHDFYGFLVLIVDGEEIGRTDAIDFIEVNGKSAVVETEAEMVEFYVWLVEEGVL